MNVEYRTWNVGILKTWWVSKICFLYAQVLTVVVGLADDVLLRMVVFILPLRVPHPGRNLSKERRVA